MDEGPKERAGEKIRRELFSLARQEREVRREIGNRVLNSQPVDDLRARRSELQERQEDLSSAVVQLESSTAMNRLTPSVGTVQAVEAEQGGRVDPISTAFVFRDRRAAKFLRRQLNNRGVC